MPHRVDRDDVRVTQRGSGLRLPEKTLSHRRVAAQGGRHDLDGHLPVQRRVRRQVHHGHPPAAQLFLDGELAFRRVTQQFQQRRLDVRGREPSRRRAPQLRRHLRPTLGTELYAGNHGLTAPWAGGGRGGWGHACSLLVPSPIPWAENNLAIYIPARPPTGRPAGD